jgi:hypothetical protein
MPLLMSSRYPGLSKGIQGIFEAFIFSLCDSSWSVYREAYNFRGDIFLFDNPEILRFTMGLKSDTILFVLSVHAPMLIEVTTFHAEKDNEAV